MLDFAMVARLLRRACRARLYALLAAAAALAFALEGVEGLVCFALAIPAVAAAVDARGRHRVSRAQGRLAKPGSPADLTSDLAASPVRTDVTGLGSFAPATESDDLDRLGEMDMPGATDRSAQGLSERLNKPHAPDDVDARLVVSGPRATPDPARGPNVPSAVHFAGEIRQGPSEPVRPGEDVVDPSVPDRRAESSLHQTQFGEALHPHPALADAEAGLNGPAGPDKFSQGLHRRLTTRQSLAMEVNEALERGHVQAFFQPQVCARTGVVSGFEALARWRHPTRGLIPPAEFLPILEEADLMRRLGEVMLRDALSALHAWQRLGLNIPRIGVNLSGVELGDPYLVERVIWELDRFDLCPDRLVVEVLETVVAAREEDAVIRNLAGLARLGCGLDLDDFGTGHASITCIRRFSIDRIKIDRSFVTGLDRDPEKQRLLGAILVIADHLGLATLAEGVETAEERHVLARLGCQHVQGFGIARPMPSEDVPAWIRTWAPHDKASANRQLRVI
jgi:EAL domain-containing protein (putative c-di-GMP-specific phosphodiesterase class I)